MKKPLLLSPVLWAEKLPDQVIGEIYDHGYYLNDRNDLISLNWQNDHLPITKVYLLKTYGKDITDYRYFGIVSSVDPFYM